MAVPDPRQESRPPRSAIRVGHRLLGLIGAAFLIVLVLTGVAAQHPTALGLDQRYVQARSLLAWYGIRAPDMGANGLWGGLHHTVSGLIRCVQFLQRRPKIPDIRGRIP